MKAAMISQAAVTANRAFEIGQQYRDLLQAIADQKRLVAKIAGMATRSNLDAVTRETLVIRWKSAEHKLNNMMDDAAALKARRVAASGELVAISRRA